MSKWTKFKWNNFKSSSQEVFRRTQFYSKRNYTHYKCSDYVTYERNLCDDLTLLHENTLSPHAVPEGQSGWLPSAVLQPLPSPHLLTATQPRWTDRLKSRMIQGPLKESLSPKTKSGENTSLRAEQLQGSSGISISNTSERPPPSPISSSCPYSCSLRAERVSLPCIQLVKQFDKWKVHLLSIYVHVNTSPLPE